MRIIRFVILMLLVAALSACGGKRERRPVETSTAQARKPSAAKPVTPPEMPPPAVEKDTAGEVTTSSPDPMTAPSPLVTREAEISTGEKTREKPAGPTALEPGCFFILCLGMNYEETVEVAQKLGRDPKTECRPGQMRPLPLPVRAGEVKRYVYYQHCGGPLDHTTFYFHRNHLIAFHIYFKPEGFEDRTVEDILKDAEATQGPPDEEAWVEPGEWGKVIWNKGDVRMTVEVLNARPFALRVVNIRKKNKAYSSADKQ